MMMEKHPTYNAQHFATIHHNFAIFHTSGFDQKKMEKIESLVDLTQKMALQCFFNFWLENERPDAPLPPLAGLHDHSCF